MAKNRCLLFWQTLASEPCTAVIFSSSSLYNKPIPVTSTVRTASSCDWKGPAAKREKLSFVAYLKRILPPSCDIIGLAADGVIGKCSHTGNDTAIGGNSCVCLEQQHPSPLLSILSPSSDPLPSFLFPLPHFSVPLPRFPFSFPFPSPLFLLLFLPLEVGLLKSS